MNAGYWVAVGIFILGIILFFYLSSRKKYRDLSAANNYDSKKRERSPKEHYKNIMDKLSLRELATEKLESIEGFGINNLASVMTGIITLVIVISIGTTIMSTLSTELSSSTAMNVTTVMESTTAFGDIIPIMMTVGIACVVLSIISSAFGGARSYD